MLGAAFALIWRPVAIMRGPLRTRGRRIDLLGLLGLLGLALMMNRLELVNELTNEYDPWLFRGGFLLTGVCTVAIIAAATHRRAWIGRLLGIRPLHWVGTRSYGLYLYHWPIYQIIREPGQQLSLRQFLTALLIALPITELSYRLVELPVRQGRLGEWMRGERKPRTKAAVQRRRRTFVLGSTFALLAGFATVSIATADVLCEGQVACDSEEGQEQIASATVTAAPPVTVRPTVPVSQSSQPGDTTPAVTEPAPVTPSPIVCRRRTRSPRCRRCATAHGRRNTGERGCQPARQERGRDRGAHPRRRAAGASGDHPDRHQRQRQ
jgi:hypothetical protein